MSSLSPHAIALTATLLSALACAGCVLWLARDWTLRARLRAHEATLERELRYVRAGIRGRALVQLQLTLCALFACGALVSAQLALLLTIPLIAYVPDYVLARMRDARTSAIEAQLNRFLVATAHALRASPALGDALASAAQLGAPFGEELELVLREHALGTPIDRALASMAERIQSPVASAAVATLRVARATGGDLSGTLESSAATLREMARLEGVVRTKTAEGRAQAVVIAIVPAPLLWLLDSLDPHFLEPVWTTNFGHGLLAVAALLWATAILAARRIMRVDI